MRNILVLGGLGTIGAPLVRALRNDHKVFVVDEQDDLYEDIGVYGTSYNDAIRCIHTEPINCIINLAEHTMIDNLNDSELIINNSYLPAKLIQICSKLQRPITTILGLWQYMQDGNTLLQRSYWLRKDLPQIFNVGNTVVTPVYIPRIIDPWLPASYYGAMINRLLHAVFNHRMFYLGDCESIYRPMKWCPVDSVVPVLQDLATRRTRKSQHILDSHLLTGDTIIRMTLDILGLSKIQVHFTKNSSKIIESVGYQHDARKWIETTVESFCSEVNTD